MDLDSLQSFHAREAAVVLADPHFEEAHEALLSALEAGIVRAAEPCVGPDGGRAWQVNAWVKQAILLGFRHSAVVPMDGAPGAGSAFDKAGYPPRRLSSEDRVRLVPGGSAIRRGAHVAAGVVVMPPAYVNVGAYVGAGTMIDSHALVGSCAQIGERVHLSAGAQVGGVLEPAGACPVVVEDEAFVGGLVGLFEGVHIGARAVLASGVVLTASTPIYDLVNGRELRREVPEGAVLVPGSRPASGDYAREHGLQVNAVLLVKIRDARTDVATALEEALR